MPVIFFMLDGVRPDAITSGTCPTLRQLIRRGSSTLSARSVMPSVTLPCHMSIYHSAPPERHGITSNVYTPMARPIPGLVETANQAGKRCAFFYNWEELRDLSRPGHLEHAFFVNASHLAHGDDLIADEAVRVLSLGEHDFAFVYFGTVDTAGHVYGWMSDGYMAQLERVDALLAKVVAALPADASFIVQADHGGHERTHGTDLDEDMTIPWIAVGPRVKPGYTITTPVSLLDTAPTLARLLGLAAPAAWEGSAVEEIFIK